MTLWLSPITMRKRLKRSGAKYCLSKKPHLKKRGYWVQLMLQIENGTIVVQLGPAWYVDKQTPRIEANDTITVTGSRVTMDGKSAIVSADIAKGSELLKLRAINGIPVWPRVPLVNRPPCDPEVTQ